MTEKYFSFKQIQLKKDLIKNIKRGHCWVYADALRFIPRSPAGSPAVLLDNRGGKAIAVGFLDAEHPIFCRSLSKIKPQQRWHLAVLFSKKQVIN